MAPLRDAAVGVTGFSVDVFDTVGVNEVAVRGKEVGFEVALGKVFEDFVALGAFLTTVGGPEETGRVAGRAHGDT